MYQSTPRVYDTRTHTRSHTPHILLIIRTKNDVIYLNGRILW